MSFEACVVVFKSFFGTDLVSVLYCLSGCYFCTLFSFFLVVVLEPLFIYLFLPALLFLCEFNFSKAFESGLAL